MALVMKCAIYARVSTNDQETSMANQQEYFKDYILRNQFEIFDIYADEAFSGTDMRKRRSFQKLLADGKQKKYDVLLAKSYSRFGRNQRETLTALAELFESGIRIIFVEDGLDSLRDKGQFGLFAWLAEQESRKISERIQLTWQLYNAEGKIHSTNAPLGYTYDKDSKNFIVHEQEAQLVRLIFQLYEKGNGIRKIAAILNERQYTTKHGRPWSHSIVRQTLTNEFYTGTLIQGRRKKIDVTIQKYETLAEKDWCIHKNHHEAIVSAEDFFRVQAQFETRSRYVRESRLSRHSSHHLFSNMITCGLCGKSFTYKCKKNEHFTPKYSCILYEQKGVVGCGHKNNAIKETLLTDLVKDELSDFFSTHFQSIYDHYSESMRKNAPPPSAPSLQKTEIQIEQQTQLSLKLLEAYTKEIVGALQFKLQNEQIEKELILLTEKREGLLAQYVEDEGMTVTENRTSDVMEQLVGLEPSVWGNEMMKRLVEKVDVDMHNNTIHVFYTFARHTMCLKNPT